ncbi:MAG: hypothetical protein WDZ90_00485 [Candidatus Paceibacterota bacterium]
MGMVLLLGATLITTAIWFRALQWLRRGSFFLSLRKIKSGYLCHVVGNGGFALAFGGDAVIFDLLGFDVLSICFLVASFWFLFQMEVCFRQTKRV